MKERDGWVGRFGQVTGRRAVLQCRRRRVRRRAATAPRQNCAINQIRAPDGLHCRVPCKRLRVCTEVLQALVHQLYTVCPIDLERPARPKFAQHPIVRNFRDC